MNKNKGLKMFLKFSDYNGYDEFFMPVSDTDKTWGSVLNHIETVLDQKYCNNEEKLIGIKLEVEIVADAPDDIEMIGNW